MASGANERHNGNITMRDLVKKPLENSTNASFGHFTLDTERRRLGANDISIKLEPKVTQLLSLLARMPGELLSRQYIENHLWPAGGIGQESLNNVVTKLRKAFNDCSVQGAYIETIQGEGYCLHFLPIEKNALVAEIKRPHQQLVAGLSIAATMTIISIAIGSFGPTANVSQKTPKTFAVHFESKTNTQYIDVEDAAAYRAYTAAREGLPKEKTQPPK